MRFLLRFVPSRATWPRRDTGSSLVELALTIPFFLLLLSGVIDFGRAFYMSMEIAGAAQAGASYGSQHPSDLAGIQSAAQQDAPDVTGLTVNTPLYGCECSDGTKYVANCSTKPTCTNNVVYRVSITAATTYHPLIPWPGVPSTINISRTAVMRGSGN